MPFNDPEKKRIDNALDKFLAKRRPPPHRGAKEYCCTSRALLALSQSPGVGFLHSGDRHTFSPQAGIDPFDPYVQDHSRKIRERCPGRAPDRGLEHDPLALAHAGRAYGHCHQLGALTIFAIHDSLALRATLSEENASPTSCERPGLSS